MYKLSSIANQTFNNIVTLMYNEKDLDSVLASQIKIFYYYWEYKNFHLETDNNFGK